LTARNPTIQQEALSVSNARPKIVSTLKFGRSVAAQVLRGAGAVAGQTAGAVVARVPRRGQATAPAPAPAPARPQPDRAVSVVEPDAPSAEPAPAPGVPEAPVTPADVARNVAPKPPARKKPAKKSSPSAKLPPRKPAPTKAAPKKAAATKAGSSSVG
jgi:hypothetical protein